MWGFLFAVPALAFILVFNVYPLLDAVYLSFTTWSLNAAPHFVGFSNYVTAFTKDQDFFPSVAVTVYYTLGVNPPLWAFGLGLAILFNRQFVLRDLFRTVYFTPVVISWVVAALVWGIIFHPTLGLSADLMRLFDRPGLAWLSDPPLVIPAMIILSVWKGLGYYMVLFLAGLQAIPPEYLEAAACDGANAWQRFWYIKLRLLKPTILFVMVISVIGSFQIFTPIQIMTGGGPAGASRVLPLLIYQDAFNYLKIGYASSLAVILFAILLILTIIQMRVMHGGEIV